MKTNNEKQKLLLEYLVSSPDTFALCKPIIKTEYFDPHLRKTVDFLHSYYDKFNAVPNPDQVFAETGVKLKLQQTTKDQIKYCSEEVEKFCRHQALVKVVLGAREKIEEDDGGAIEAELKAALTISLNKNLGINYYNDPAARVEAMSKSVERTPTGWHRIDDLMNGGMARTEMLLFSANSGGGKSIVLANLALNFLIRKFNVLYITLELSEELVAQRFDIMNTGIPSVQWLEKRNEIVDMLTLMSPHMGRLDIKKMPSGTSANVVRAYLKELELRNNGYIPDLLIVDYLDKMGPNSYVSADNVFEKDKQISEQLGDILDDYGIFGASASQQNRGAVMADEINQSHIAGGISKVNETDWHISIILNKAMKASGEIGFQFIKTRSSAGEGETVYLHWDNKQLRVMNPKEDIQIDEDGVILDKVAKIKGNKKKGRSLEDLMNI